MDLNQILVNHVTGVRSPHVFRRDGADVAEGAEILWIPMDAGRTLLMVLTVAAESDAALLGDVTAIVSSVGLTADEQNVPNGNAEGFVPFRMDDLLATIMLVGIITVNSNNQELANIVLPALEVVEPIIAANAAEHAKTMTPEQIALAESQAEEVLNAVFPDQKDEIARVIAEEREGRGW